MTFTHVRLNTFPKFLKTTRSSFDLKKYDNDIKGRIIVDAFNTLIGHKEFLKVIIIPNNKI